MPLLLQDPSARRRAAGQLRIPLCSDAEGGEAEEAAHPVLLQLRLPTLQLKLASLFFPLTGDRHL